MMSKVIFLIVMPLVFFAAVHSYAADDAVSEEKANALFIEASQKVKDAAETEKKSCADALVLYREALSKFKTLCEKYPSSQIGDGLARGEVKIGSYSLSGFEKEFLPGIELKAWAEKDPLACAILVGSSIEDPSSRVEVLLYAAGKCLESGRKEDALYALPLCLNGLSAVKDVSLKAGLLLKSAGLYIEAGDKENGQAVLTDAFKSAVTIDDVNKRTKNLYETAAGFAQAGMFDHALSAAGSIAGSSARVAVLTEIAGAFEKADRKKDAADLLNEAAETANTIKNEYHRAAAIGEIAGIYARIGEKAKADALLSDFYKWADTISVKEFKITVLPDLAEKYARAGQGRKAEEILSKTLAMVKPLKNEMLKADVLLKIVDGYSGIGNEKKGLEALSYAFETISAVNNIDYRNKLSAEIAGRFAVFKMYDQALSAANSISAGALKSAVLTDIARACAKAGQGVRSLALLSDAEKAAAGDRAVSRGLALSEIGAVYLAVGEKEKGSEILSSAIQDAGSIDNARERSGLIAEIASRYSENGMWADALETAAMIEDDSFKAVSLADIGSKFAQSGQNIDGSLEAPLREIVRKVNP